MCPNRFPSAIPFDSPKEFKEHLALPDLKCLSYDVIHNRRLYEKTAEKFTKERSRLVSVFFSFYLNVWTFFIQQSVCGHITVLSSRLVNIQH